MLKRIITGVVLLAVAGGLIVAQGWYLRAALLIMALTSFFEMYRAFRKKGMHPVTWPGYVFCVAEALCIWFEDKLAFLDGNHLLMGMTACVMLGIICVVIKGKPDFEAVEATVMPMIYPGLLFLAFMELSDLQGRGMVTLALLMTILTSAMNDTFALFVGKALGKRKLIPGISPNKTVAGAMAGLAASVAFSVTIPLAVVAVDAHFSGNAAMTMPAPWWAFAIFGLVAGVISQLGDLTASLVKRYCGIKDYGKLFPGHGGMMDRLDAILFTAAAVYAFFTALGY